MRTPHSKTRKGIITTIAAALLLIAGLYLALLLLSPQATYFNPSRQNNLAQAPTSQQNRLLIPKINLDIPYQTGGAEVLNTMAWHRHPDRGNPEKGGNFILSGHRFEIGLTPGETIQKSPFYHLDKLAIGDEILVDYNNRRYTYHISEKFTVKPTQTEIEAPSTTAKLTLYTCTLGGAADGREVLVATPASAPQ